MRSKSSRKKQESKPILAGRYEIHQELGSGGMGTVFKAIDRRTATPVAVKILNFKASEFPMLHLRMVREFRAARDLEHPNIVHALASEKDKDLSFLVYELVEGTSVGARIDSTGRLPEVEAIKIITQISQALHYAHQRKVIHRDVKPDNILVLPDGRAKLTDFGLAKDYSADKDQDLTRAASALGTPHFMAPEQFSSAKTAGILCDVYSLGATLYNMLTGVLPFDAKFPLAILAKKETCNLRPVRAYAPEVSEHVDSAIRSCLNPDPDLRPESSLAFFKLLTARTGSKQPLRSPGSGATKPSHDDRRAAIRYPLRVGSYGVVDADVHPGSANEDVWPLVVHDVSVGGVGILLARRFEPNTVLSIELALSEAEPPKRFKCKVVRVQTESAGHWVHGCT